MASWYTSSLPLFEPHISISCPCMLLHVRTTDSSSLVGLLSIGWLVLSHLQAARVVFCTWVPRIKPVAEA